MPYIQNKKNRLYRLCIQEQFQIPKVVQFAKDLFFFDVTTCMTAKRCLAHATGETTHMPAQVVNL